MIWAEVNPGRILCIYYFDVFGTGQPLPDLLGSEKRRYVGTVQYPDSTVWHVYSLSE